MKDCKPINNPERSKESKDIKSVENMSNKEQIKSPRLALLSNNQTLNKNHNKEDTKTTILCKNAECKSLPCPNYCSDKSICQNKQSEVNYDKNQHNQTFSTQTHENINPATIPGWELM